MCLFVWLVVYWIEKDLQHNKKKNTNMNKGFISVAKNLKGISNRSSLKSITNVKQQSQLSQFSTNLKQTQNALKQTSMSLNSLSITTKSTKFDQSKT